MIRFTIPIHLARKLGDCRKGISTIEFAMIAPVFLLILAGIVDLGGMLAAKSRLNAAVSASANYVLVNADQVNSQDGATLTTTAAAIVAGNLEQQAGAVTITINNGLTYTLTDGVVASSGASSTADKCYCPQVAGSVVNWGSAVTCGNACASGGYAGKFVSIAVSQSYTPMFGGYGILEDDGTVTAQAVVKPQ